MLNLLHHNKTTRNIRNNTTKKSEQSRRHRTIVKTTTKEWKLHNKRGKIRPRLAARWEVKRIMKKITQRGAKIEQFNFITGNKSNLSGKSIRNAPAAESISIIICPENQSVR